MDKAAEQLRFPADGFRQRRLITHPVAPIAIAAELKRSKLFAVTKT
jgi:hypothetical protein